MTSEGNFDGAGLIMSNDTSILPSLFILSNDKGVSLNSISDIFIDDEHVVIKFPLMSYRIGARSLVLGGGTMFPLFIEHLMSGRFFLLSLCDSQLNIRSSIEVGLKK